MNNPFSLEGKTILVTGSSSGIGKQSAIECAKMGAQVIVTGRNIERLNAVYTSMEGTNNIQIVADLTTEDGIRELVNALPEIDGAFFCAGVTDTTLIKFLDKDKINRVFDINIIAPMILTKNIIKQKKIKKNASLVYMSSMGANVVTTGLGIYAASKGALNSFMRSVANELSSKKVRANSIMASMVKTELLETLSSISHDELVKDEARYPLGYGTPTDIAYAVVYLLSDASKWITGTSIMMDGGSTLG